MSNSFLFIIFGYPNQYLNAMKNFLPFIVAFLTFLLFSANAQNQFENGGFEEWEAIAEFEEPVNWSTAKTCVPENLAQIAPVTVEKDAGNPHSGNYCVHVYSVEAAFNITATGNITNGRVHANTDPDKGYMFIDVNDDRWNTKINIRPDSLTGWFRCSPKEEDHGMVKVLLSSDSATLPSGDSLNWIGYAQFDMPSTQVSEWTRFSVPFNYYNEQTPAYMLCVITSSIGVQAVAGSEVWVDDLLLTSPSSVSELTEKDINVYTVNNRLKVYINDFKTRKAVLRIYDIKGDLIFKSNIKTGIKYDTGLHCGDGIYIVVLNTDDKKLAKKVFVAK